MSAANVTTTVVERDLEQVVICRDPRSGLESVIAVHDTGLGPALGGIRMRAYPDLAAAAADAMGLAEAMTYKAALAGLDLGGGKSVINSDPRVVNREELLIAHARFIEALGGRYIPGVDMGTTVEDLELVGKYVTRVSSQRRDPSLYTAQGVVAAMRAAARLDGASSMGGARVAVQGLGHVGRLVVEILHGEGAVTVVSDIDPERVRQVCAEFGSLAVDPEEVLRADADVLCPCAAGSVIDADVVAGMKARFVVGAANTMLAAPGLAVSLRARGVVYVPDFVANAGGLIACHAELLDDDSDLQSQVDNIGNTSTVILERAQASGTDTVTVAVRLARERLDAAATRRPYFGSPSR